MIKLLIFDLDDTLYNEREYVLSGFREIARIVSQKTAYSPTEVYATLLESFIRDGRGKNIDRLISHFNLTVGKDELIKIYREHQPKISLDERLVKLLKQLRKSFKLALLTNGWVAAQKQKVAALGLDQYFDFIAFAQEEGLEFRKPHQRYFLKVLEYFHCQPSEALMIGDDPITDIQGAETIGMSVYHVTNATDWENLEEHVEQLSS